MKTMSPPSWCALVFALALGLFSGNSARAQYSNVPQILYQGTLYNYQGEGTDTFTGNGCDFYVDSSGNTAFMIDFNGALYDANGNFFGGNYDYVNQDGWGGAFAMSWDGLTVLGVPLGIVVFDPNPISVQNVTSTFTAHSGNQYSVPTFFQTGNSIYVGKFFSTAGGMPSTYVQVDASPWYWYQYGGNMNGAGLYDQQGNLLLDGRYGWPATNITNGLHPQQIYVGNRPFNLSTTSVSVSGENFTTQDNYTGLLANEYLRINRTAVDGTLVGANGSSYFGHASADLGPTAITFTFDIDTDNFSTDNFNPPNYQYNIPIALTPVTPAPPAFGPAYISWDNNLVPFVFTAGQDIYWLGDSNGNSLYTVSIASDGTVSATNATTTISGTFDLTAKVFQFSGAPDSADIIALDANGNPYPNELVSGMTLLFGAPGRGQQMLREDGVVMQFPQYTYRRPDGSWAVKYGTVGNDLADGIYLVQDESGNYTSPPYQFIAAAGDTTVNAISSWPATNIYPPQLYINGLYCQMVSGSQYDSGAGFPRTGGVSYRAWAYDLTVVLSWNWTDANSGFQGFVTGKYGESSSFKGNWDGLGNFTNMTNSAIATVLPPTVGAVVGPPEVSVNGSVLQYSASASAAVNANPPFQGALSDVYVGSLGQTLIIDNMGGVQYLPSSLNPGSPAISGSYSFETRQFNFGTGGNTVTITNSDGSNSTVVVTAADAAGHNLTTPSGGSTNGGVAELTGGLDVRGNSFTLGSWTTGDESVFGLGIAYGDAASGSGSAAQLNLVTTRAAVNWSWIHPSTDGGRDQITAMLLDSAHRVQLYDPAHPSNANVVLDPGGASMFHGPVRIQPQGDIPMISPAGGPTPP